MRKEVRSESGCLGMVAYPGHSWVIRYVVSSLSPEVHWRSWWASGWGLGAAFWQQGWTQGLSSLAHDCYYYLWDSIELCPLPTLMTADSLEVDFNLRNREDTRDIFRQQRKADIEAWRGKNNQMVRAPKVMEKWWILIEFEFDGYAICRLGSLIIHCPPGV